jgi:hypothetical protein
MEAPTIVTDEDIHTGASEKRMRENDRKLVFAVGKFVALMHF